jgi:hypothetical protein
LKYTNKKKKKEGVFVIYKKISSNLAWTKFFQSFKKIKKFLLIQFKEKIYPFVIALYFTLKKVYIICSNYYLPQTINCINVLLKLPKNVNILLTTNIPLIKLLKINKITKSYTNKIKTGFSFLFFRFLFLTFWFFFFFKKK